MSSHRRPWDASVRIVLLASFVLWMLAAAGPARAQTSAELGVPRLVEPEDSLRVPAPPRAQPRDGRAWASLTFVGVTHYEADRIASWTVGYVGLFRGPFTFGIMGAVADGVLLGGQLGGGMVIDEDGVSSLGGSIGPRLEILFGDPGTPLFVAGDLWLGVSAARNTFGGLDAFTLLGGGASFGVHVFVSREISISPLVELAYARWLDSATNVIEATLGAQLAGWW